MRIRYALLACFTVGCIWLSVNATNGVAAEKKDTKAAPTFAADVQLIINTNCVNCHNATKKKGGINLESLESLMKTVKSGDPDHSKLYKSVSGAKGAKPMPPKKRLPAEQVEVVKAWIASGAKEK